MCVGIGGGDGTKSGSSQDSSQSDATQVLFRRKEGCIKRKICFGKRAELKWPVLELKEGVAGLYGKRRRRTRRTTRRRIT